MNDVLNVFFGSLEITYIIVGFLYAIGGIILSLAIDGLTRDVESPRTPVKFDFKFFLQDNLKRVILALLLTFFIMRFSTELLGTTATVYIGFACGLCTDVVAKFVRNMVRNYINSKTTNNE